jgi:hypothetical protein
MSFAPPRPRDMFSDVADNAPHLLAERFEAYKSALAECHNRSLSAAADGSIGFVREQGIVHNSTPRTRMDALEADIKDVTKSLSADQVAQVTQALAAAKGVMADVGKDWTLSNPLASGLVPYDLMPALMMLVPRSFILRNQISRIPGQGTGKEYRRILGVSNSGSGGVANLSTFFSSASASTSFSGLALNRPAKISYSADKHVVGYVEQGVSDEVVMQAQFAGQGYADMRQLSHTAVTWATMIGEERNIINARGSGTGYSGVLGAPAGFVNANLVASAGGALANTAFFVKVTQVSGQGESTVSAQATITPTLNQKVTVTPPTLANGATSYNVYASVTSGSEVFQGTALPGQPFVISALVTGSAAFPVADGTASALAYDGLIATYTNAAISGYVKQLGSTLSTSNPGVEFQTMFASLFASVLADPEAVLLAAGVRVELSDAIKSVGNPNGYRITVENDGAGHQIGTVVTAIQNEVTGSMVDLTVHPYFPAGTAVAWSKTLPIPDSGVSETTQIANVQDLMMLEWPVIQMTYDLSSYIYGTLLHYAPAWGGAITGIQ